MGKRKRQRGDLDRVFKFDMQVDPDALTSENVAEITDAIAKAIAAEITAGHEIGDLGEIATGFHIRIGGGHSRSFSKTADHKRVDHSRVVIAGEV